MRCLHCQQAAAFRFCSNACFLEYSKGRAGIDCGICSYDPLSKRIGRSTNRICSECAKDPENVGWGSGRREVFGLDSSNVDWWVDKSRVDRADPRQKFSTELARNVARLIAAGYSHAETATRLKCSLIYVKKVSAYWNGKSFKMLKALNKANRRKV